MKYPHDTPTAEVLVKVNKEEIRRIIKEIKIHARQIEQENRRITLKDKLDKLFERSE